MLASVARRLTKRGIGSPEPSVAADAGSRCSEIKSRASGETRIRRRCMDKGGDGGSQSRRADYRNAGVAAVKQRPPGRVRNPRQQRGRAFQALGENMAKK